MLQENHINAIVSLTSARWVRWYSTTRNAGVSEHRHKWIQCADSSTRDLLTHMNDICNFIDQMASPALSSLVHLLMSTIMKQMTSHTVNLRRRYRFTATLEYHDRRRLSSPILCTSSKFRKQTSCASFNQSKESNRARISLVSFKFLEEVEYEVWEDEDNTVPKAPYKAFLEIRAALLKEKGLTGDEPLAPLTL
ncbi:unnamed protein product [Penicillium nalgiovense]|uniref:Uncharacterized protein n=1 Tax=Penicillium nalgiovense TaxID=60175 RepID=A0A9W4IPB4_PENNA|nr:unnamed protein product [Penicillium nalgiovense]CAG7985331.1 unnamed protein product [Penicillium nalgiovense]CAG8056720.1 unnamed protein product [Penicillium nalgiovense]CAG8089491.1 unnamed protein product [Penicillium nalgiovense]CAG8115753.1 unnamed protein product [Penicillium nalgiovense]